MMQSVDQSSNTFDDCLLHRNLRDRYQGYRPIAYLSEGGKVGLFGGAGVGKEPSWFKRWSTTLLRAWWYFRVCRSGTYSWRNDLYWKWRSLALSISQQCWSLNEPPGARMRVALTGLTCRILPWCEGQMSCSSLTTSFRFTQAGSIPPFWDVCRQPVVTNQHLHWNGSITEASHRLERFCNLYAGHLHSAIDYTDPAPATAFALGLYNQLGT